MWDSLLQKHVNEAGMVDYTGMQADIKMLDKYLSVLQMTPPRPEWTESAVMAYWINAYNAFTVKLVLDKWSLESLRDLNQGNPWILKWIEIGDEILSLDDIEHQRLRARYKVPAIHFALNCASRSCPPLATEAYTADNLQRLLDKQADRFINGALYNRIEDTEVNLSRIFDWYAADFGDVRAYINRFSRTPIRDSVDLKYLEYDWSLNRQ